MERIVLLGCAGSGKTTLAQRLGALGGCPCITIDELWQPKWSKSKLPEFRRRLRDLHACPRWVSDGNFADASFDIRLPRATLILWIEQPRLLCAVRALRRTLRHGEQHRWHGLRAVFTFIWRFDRVNRPRIEAARAAFGPQIPLQRLAGDREIAEFLASFAAHQETRQS